MGEEGDLEFETAGERADRTDVLDRKVEFWESLAGYELSGEDARQIRDNLTGFFRLLLQWDAAEQATALGECRGQCAAKRPEAVTGC